MVDLPGLHSRTCSVGRPFHCRSALGYCYFALAGQVAWHFGWALFIPFQVIRCPCTSVFSQAGPSCFEHFCRPVTWGRRWFDVFACVCGKTTMRDHFRWPSTIGKPATSDPRGGSLCPAQVEGGATRLRRPGAGPSCFEHFRKPVTWGGRWFQHSIFAGGTVLFRSFVQAGRLGRVGLVSCSGPLPWVVGSRRRLLRSRILGASSIGCGLGRRLGCRASCLRWLGGALRCGSRCGRWGRL